MNAHYNNLIRQLAVKVLRTQLPAYHLIAVVLLSVFLVFFSSNPSSSGNDPVTIRDNLTYTQQSSEQLRKPVTLSIPKSELEPKKQTHEAALSISSTVQSEQVKPGDNLSLLFQRAGLSDASLLKLLNSIKDSKKLIQLRPGQTYHFEKQNDELLSLVFEKDQLNQFKYTKTETGYQEEHTLLEPDTFLAYREASITKSLFMAGKKAGIDDKIVMELANIFGWDIDFALDIRMNDSFKVLYEEKFLNGEKIGAGSILATEFTNRGVTYQAVRYTDQNGEANYFTPKGKSMRKAFLRTPVDFARISSHFNLRRKHPLLNTIRAHKGTDYAAPHGTAIRATGDGKVVWAGTKGGYGRTVIIQHGQTYKTLYAHMSKYGRNIRSGSRVKQGQIIGYVGSTGLATGPHLHYEFYVNGAVRNPVRVPLPKASSIKNTQLARFKSQTQQLVIQLQNFGKRIEVASATPSLIDLETTHSTISKN